MVAQSFNSPVALLLLSFIMALSLIMANIDNWQVHIHEDLPVFISLAVISFSFGCLISGIISEKVYSKSFVNESVYRIPEVSDKRMLVLFFLVPGVCTFAYLIISMKIGSVGDAGNNIFRNIYVNSAQTSSNFIFHQFREITVATAEVSLISIFANNYYYKKRFKLMTIVPLVCYVICTMLSTDRNIFLRFVIYALSLWVFFITETSERSRAATNRDVFRKAVIIVAISTGAFYLLGKLKSYTSNFERMIGIYGGSGLYNFNLTIDRFGDYSYEYGKVTFSQLIRTLGALGFNVESYAGPSLGNEMIIGKSANGYVYASNIYSAMMPYISDFGTFGLILFPLIMGAFFGLLYSVAKAKKTEYLWGIYSLLIYAVVYFTITEQFFMRLHLGLFYELFWFTVVFSLAFGRRRIADQKWI